MRVLDAVLARLAERGVRDTADQQALAYVAMVAMTADGGSWPGLPIEVTDRNALIDALVTAVEVRTLEAALLAPATLLQVGHADPGEDRDSSGDEQPAADVDRDRQHRAQNDEPDADQRQRPHVFPRHAPDRTGRPTTTTPHDPTTH